jgi:ABC-type glycerol-3-phosphate transport system permease component
MDLIRRNWEGAAYTVLMLVLMAPMAFVFFWMVSVSFRTNLEATASPPSSSRATRPLTDTATFSRTRPIRS